VATTTSFDAARRERFLTAFAAGETIEAAAAAAGVSRTTVARWRARGAEPDARPEVAEFASRFAVIREAACRRDGASDEPLTEDAAWVLLECSAREGSVVAQKIVWGELRRRRGEAEREAEALRSVRLAGAEDDPADSDDLARRRAERDEATRHRIEELEHDEWEARARARGEEQGDLREPS
jgi:Homeodomain-like domain